LLYALLGNFPLHEDLAPRLMAIILRTNFVDLFATGLRSGSMALQIASLQAIHLGDAEVRLHLKDQLVKAAKWITNHAFPKARPGHVDYGVLGELDEVHSLLLDSALNVSIAAQPPENVITSFADLVGQLVEVSHPLMRLSRPLVQRLCEELPISQAVHLWPLLVRLRAA